MAQCKITGRELSNEKLYSEKDISDYLSTFLSKVPCGDYFSDVPWGTDQNKNLYLAIFALSEERVGIKSKVGCK